uniref:Uncharacterized protein n=1 Tax=Geobacter metallireducens TaxID=28232 RepID=A0A831UFS6_GEOME
MAISRNKEMALRAWIEGHLDVTTASMPEAMARQWQRLLMEDETSFYRLALFGFVRRRRRDTGNREAFPSLEFEHFCGEFIVKVRQVLRGRGQAVAMPIFERVGRMTVMSAQGMRTTGGAQ